MNDQLSDIDGLWNFDDPAGSEERFRAMLTGVVDPAARAVVLSQIARAEGLQSRFDEAHATLDQASALLEPGPSLPLARCLLERGRVYNSSGRRAEASPLFLAALSAAQQVGADYYAIDAAHMLAIVEPPEGQLEWAGRAIQMAEATQVPRARRWLGALYNNLGWTYHDMGEYEKALDIFQRALRYRQEQEDPAPIRIARWCVARTLRSLNRLEEALQIQQELLAENTEDGYISEELGELYLALGKPEEARPHFARAYALLSKDDWLVKNEAQRLERIRSLG